MELRNAVLTAATLATLASPLNSLAQFATADTRSGSALEEIVVTAQKRSESLQSVPIAITALGAEELASRGITGIGSLNRGEVPALRVQPFAGQQTVYLMTIRGVSQSSGADVSFENPVPLYIDDVYYGRASGLGLELNELERIEVLRGPQGTLFGKNAVGGAVRFISKAPTGEFGLRSTFEAGNFGYWKVLGHIDLPSVAGIATKLDVLATDNDGWQKNPAPGQENFGRLKSTGIKFSALTRPVDGLTLDFAADYTDVKSTEVFNQLLSSTDPYLLAAWQPQPHRVETIPGPTYRPLSPEHYWGGRLTATWDISSSVSLKSISAYRDDRTYLHNTATTSAALPGAFIGSTIPYLSGPTVIYDINHSQFSEELQLVGTHDTVQWVTGLFFMREHASEISTTYFGTAYPNAQLIPITIPGVPFPIPFPLNVGTPVALDPPYFEAASLTGEQITTKSEGIFAQATWRPEALAKKWAFTGGVRVARDEKEAVRPVGFIWPSAYATSPSEVCPCAPRKITQTKTLPMASVAYEWTDDTQTYAKYSTGYQAAGFGMPSRTFQGIKASTLTSYELGQKTTLFDNRVRLNVAAFYQRWKDVQQSVQTTDVSVLEWYSGPEVKAKGLELDSAFVLLDGLTLNLSGSYGQYNTKAIPNPYPNPNVAGSAPVFGNVLQAPKWTGSALLQWDIAHVSYGIWRANASATTTSEYFTVPNAPQPVKGYTLVDARFGLADIPLTGDLTMNVNLWGKNIFNRDYQTYLYSAPGVAGFQVASPFGEPRTYGVQVGVNFK